MTTMKVKEIAVRLGGELVGDGSVEIKGVGGIRYAAAGDLAYVSQARYASDAESTRASALVVGRDWEKALSIPVIKVAKPEDAFAEIARLFAPPPVQYLPGIHPTAVIGPGVVIGKDAHIGPYCVIGREASIGDRTVLVGHNVIGEKTSIGEDGLLYPMVSVRESVRIGRRFIAHNGVVIGSDGFGYTVDAKGVRTKIPQIGIVEIGDDVEIGANSTVDRARFGKTTIGNGVKIDNMVVIAHNVTIGDHVVLVAQVGVAGSSSVGRHSILAGQVGVAGHLVLGDQVVVGAQSGVTKDVPSKAVVMGFPAMPQKQFATNLANLNRFPEFKQRVAALEEKIKELEARINQA